MEDFTYLRLIFKPILNIKTDKTRYLHKNANIQMPIVQLFVWKTLLLVWRDCADNLVVVAPTNILALAWKDTMDQVWSPSVNENKPSSWSKFLVWEWTTVELFFSYFKLLFYLKYVLITLERKIISVNTSMHSSTVMPHSSYCYTPVFKREMFSIFYRFVN